MLKLLTDYNELKANEERWNTLKLCVKHVMEKNTSDGAGLALLLKQDTVFKLMFYMETISLLSITLSSMYYQDNPTEGNFVNRDLVDAIHENIEFLSFLATQLTLDIQGDWKQRAMVGEEDDT